MELQQVTYDICRHYLRDRKMSLPEGRYKTLEGYLRGRNFDQLVICADSAIHDVTGIEEARTLYQIQSFFKKNKSFTNQQSARLAALISFEEAEEACARTNERLDNYWLDKSDSHPMHQAIVKMEKYIDQALGPFPDFLSEIPKLVRVTAGATVDRSRRESLPYLKVSRKLSCTPGARPYLNALSEFFGYGEIRPKLFSGNRVVFVPKSWKTDRTIACESTGNIALQLAFDRYVKRCLRRKGIDLSDQTRNQLLARQGSISGNLATIDLSSASDTLSYNILPLLFPKEWFEYLRSIRASNYEMYTGIRQEYHKFSSMGNGATFGIETLVFAAACFAVGSEVQCVYGDDIIIETHLVDDLLALLAFLGFTVNTEKSFSTGPMRESCGKFWFSGTDITPWFFKEADNRKSVLSHIVNNCMMISDSDGHLQKYLAKFVLDERLPLVPYNSDSMSGVWIHPFHAYRRKLIRLTKRGFVKFRGYLPETYRVVSQDRRTFFLWCLKAQSRKYVDPFERLYRLLNVSDKRLRSWLLGDVLSGNPEEAFYEPDCSSEYTQSTHKYKRGWVHWKPVVDDTDHVYLWSEYLSTIIPKAYR